MSTIEETKNALQHTTPAKSLKDLIESSAKELGRALPEHMRPERIVRIALTCIRQTPELAKCTPESFLGALFTAAQLGVEPIAGRAYLLPFNNAKKKPDWTWHTVKECQFVMGYKGLVDLFYRHEKAVNLEWGIVREGDAFDFEKGTNSFLHHRPNKLKDAPVVGYWVMANLQGGGKPFHYMTEAECLEHGMKHSKAWDKKNECFRDSSPWLKEKDSMCLKTVLVQLMKILPISVELQQAVEADESARDIRPGIDNVLDIPDQTNWKLEDEKQNSPTEGKNA